MSGIPGGSSCSRVLQPTRVFPGEICVCSCILPGILSRSLHSPGREPGIRCHRPGRSWFRLQSPDPWMQRSFSRVHPPVVTPWNEPHPVFTRFVLIRSMVLLFECPWGHFDSSEEWGQKGATDENHRGRGRNLGIFPPVTQPSPPLYSCTCASEILIGSRFADTP